MAPKPEREDLDTPRPRWVAWLIVIVMAMVMAGMLNIGWRLMGG
jgi:cytochrome c